MKKNDSWFTLVEIIVAATILVILTTIWFYSYTNNLADARDWKRKSDAATIGSQLNLYKRQRWAFPAPGNSFQIVNHWFLVANQWFLNNDVSLSTAESLSLDPDLDIPYVYSVTRSKQEYQIAMSLENNDSPLALVQWNYKSVSKNILPTIVLALSGQWAVEINASETATNGNINRTLFVYDQGFHNLPYGFENATPQSDGTPFSTALLDVQSTYWQNIDYRSCWEIFTAAKWISPSGTTDEYQILNSSGTLTNTWCLAP